jgi:monooxygenase
MAQETFDVIVVGAGLSGIAAGYYLQTECPDREYMILEGRDAIGGTWDLFRYPGVRSDSDMFTLGYSFRPWTADKSIAEGDLILDYVRQTAHEFGIDEHIRFGHRVCGASWSSEAGHWTIDVERSDGERLQFSCQFLFMCTGYYKYDHGYTPDWRGMTDYQGDIVHPQQWSSDIDHAGKRVIVIGSGATAVTLVPALAERAAHVTMLQRSPSYVVSRPSEDKVAQVLHAVLPDSLAHRFSRWRAILGDLLLYHIARWFPQFTKNNIIKDIRAELGDDYDVETHFNPRYNPWDQRLCLVPDSDLFEAIKSGNVSVVTDHIDTFTEDGIQLQSGDTLTADMIVTATGLVMRIMDGVTLQVDGETIALGDTLAYKGMMYSNVPNLASAFGYTNASWTLKCELTCQYVCRLLNHMSANGYDKCVPQLQTGTGTEPIVNFTSGYIKRAMASLPQQGDQRPWRVYQNYVMDLMIMRYGQLDDGTMVFK